MRRQGFLTAAILFLWFNATPAAFLESPQSFVDGVIDRADIVVKSVRLTDNGDNDGFADPNETVSLFVTLRNSSGADRDGIVVTVASTDPTVDCIPSPVVAFGSLLAGEERESAVPAVFRVANVARSDPLASLTATFDFQISGDDFGGTVRPQQVVLDLDLNVSGGLLPSDVHGGLRGRRLRHLHDDDARRATAPPSRSPTATAASTTTPTSRTRTAREHVLLPGIHERGRQRLRLARARHQLPRRRPRLPGEPARCTGACTPARPAPTPRA